MDIVSEHLIDDLAALDSQELTSIVIEDMRTRGNDFILPNPFSENEYLTVFHNRIQRIQDLPYVQPAVIEDKVVTGMARLFPDKEPLDDLDKIFNVRKTGMLKGDRLSEVGLTKVEQVLLARGVLIATTSRIDESLRNNEIPSQTQIKLQKTAIRFINHMRTNQVHIPSNGTMDDRNKFISAYSAAYIAGIVYEEEKSQGLHRTNSITQAMSIPIRFGAVLSRDDDALQSVFTDGEVGLHTDDDGTGFAKKHPAEIDESRIRELRKIQFSYGDEHAKFTFYETTKAFRKGGKGGGGAVAITGATTDKQPNPDERYAVMVIEEPTDEGRVIRHAVAENKQVGNACYGLRQEVLDEWENILGVRLTWQDILYPKRLIARQIGARVFTHAVNSNVPKRLLEYLKQDGDSVVYETFSKIFDTEAELFDDNMNPTEKNIMPPYFIDLIKKSSELKQLWPMIRSHGYATTYRLLRNIEAAELVKPVSQRVSPARKTSLVDRALEIFRSSVQADFSKD